MEKRSNREEAIMDRLQEHYDYIKDDYEVVGIFLQGSQNYELDYSGSDIDSKAIVLPTFEDIVFNRRLSTTLILENGEHIEVKDVRLMFNTFKKQNINFLEILFTKFFILNEDYRVAFEQLTKNAELIAHYDSHAAVRCMSGMSMEKYKALKHPYPSTIAKIEKYGYDPKQLHHIVRMYEFIYRYTKGEPFADCLLTKEKESLMQIKLGYKSLEEAEVIAAALSTTTKRLKDEYIANNPQVINSEAEVLLNTVMVDLMKTSLAKEIEKS